MSAVQQALRWYCSSIAGVIAARRPGQSDKAAPGVVIGVKAGSAPLGSTSYTVPGSNVLFVSPSGNDSTGTGASGVPFKTVQKAINTATTSGAWTVVMRAGSYHESITTPANKDITLQAYPSEVCYLDGTSIISSAWIAGSGVWTTDYAPTFDRNLGTTLSAYPGMTGRNLVDQVWLNGGRLTQVADNTTPGAGQFSVNVSTHKLTIGSDPTGKTVAYTDLNTAGVFSGKCNLKGIGVRRYSPVDMEFLNAMLYFGGSTSGSGMENCVVSESGLAGWSLAVGGVTLTAVTSQDHRLTGGLFTTADGLMIQRNLARRCNRGGWTAQPITGGIKGTRTAQFTIRDSYATDCPGAMGIWLDVSCIRFSLVNNQIDCSGTTINGVSAMNIGMEIEEADGGNISGTQYRGVCAGNKVFNGKIGINCLSSGMIDFYNNDLRGNDIGFYSQQDRPQNTGTAGSPNRSNAECPWHTVGLKFCNNILDVTGSGNTNFAIQMLGYDDNPGTDRFWDQYLLVSGNRFHTSGTMVSAGKVGGARDPFNTPSALAASGSAYGGPPGAKCGTNYQGTDMGTISSYAVVVPDAIGALIGVPSGVKTVGPVAVLLPTIQEP